MAFLKPFYWRIAIAAVLLVLAQIIPLRGSYRHLSLLEIDYRAKCSSKPLATPIAAPRSGSVAAARTNPIKTGYTAFGDSFAAGIGTESTEGSGCRIGGFSYPKQLMTTVNNADFENLPCSAAKIENVVSGGQYSQEDAWNNPDKADIATISIGGNNIGFYDILTACVLRVGGPFAGDCDTEVNKAYTIMQGSELYDKIQFTLMHIITKSSNDNFKIYMTGYACFFNAETDWCDDTSFRIYNPHHTSNSSANGEPWLKKALRLQLNRLVTDLNAFLEKIVDSINSYYKTESVIFVDPNPYFNGHRWCEQDNGQDVQEPDWNRKDTWFFLSNWDDDNLPGNASAASDFVRQQQVLQLAGNTTALPDPSTCEQTLAKANNSDWAGMFTILRLVIEEVLWY